MGCGKLVKRCWYGLGEILTVRTLNQPVMARVAPAADSSALTPQSSSSTRICFSVMGFLHMACRVTVSVLGLPVVGTSTGWSSRFYRVHGWGNENDLLLHVDTGICVPGTDDRGQEVVRHAIDDL